MTGTRDVTRAAACLLLAVACAAPPRGQLAPTPALTAADSATLTSTRAPRFYFARDFGSERQFNPLSQIVNEGFDILRASDRNRHVLSRDYGQAIRNVWRSTAHFDETIRFYGGARLALRNEWLPMTVRDDRGGGAWVANYELHLLGSGMVSVRMEEWFAQHGSAHPTLDAVATLMASHVANEIVENDLANYPNEDVATDLLIFDPLGILMWRLDAVQRAFSGPLEMTSWAGQPALDVNSRTLQNVGQDFILRAPIPGTERWRLMYTLGMKNLLGVSYGDRDRAAWSVAFGPYAEDNPIVDARSGARTARLRFSGGLFYDVQGSLMFSAVFLKQSRVARWTVNAYPGLLRVGRFEPGLWLTVPPGGGARVGFATRLGLGLGYGPNR